MNNPAAYPRTAHSSMGYEDLGSYGADPQVGMSLRDYFAAAALTGLLSIEGEGGYANSWVTAADDAYKAADAMLKRRAEQ